MNQSSGGSAIEDIFIFQNFKRWDAPVYFAVNRKRLEAIMSLNLFCYVTLVSYRNQRYVFLYDNAIHLVTSRACAITTNITFSYRGLIVRDRQAQLEINQRLDCISIKIQELWQDCV